MRRHCLVGILAVAALAACGDPGDKPGDPVDDTSQADDTAAPPLDADGDGITPADGDCDDDDPEVYPGRTEDCNGKDDNCNEVADEGWPDTDGDGTADCVDVEECDGLDNDGDGEVDEGEPDTDGDGTADCVDVEECDGLDNDGDGEVDEGFDQDGDGYATCDPDSDGWDCDDGDDEIHPGAAETEGDAIDNDCDGLIDEGQWQEGDLVITEIMVNPDVLSDSIGEWIELYNTSGRAVYLDGLTLLSDPSEQARLSADEPILLADGAYALLGNGVAPEAEGGVPLLVLYEGVTLSNESDTLTILAGEVSLDTVFWDDGATMPDEAGASMSLDPGFTDAWSNDEAFTWCAATEPWSEVSDLGSPGADNPLCPSIDQDGDGYSALDGDCDESDAAINPEATEIWYDGIDQDCDGWSDDDADMDGWDAASAGGSDCVDTDPSVNPGAAEICDGLGLDEDCDGLVDDEDGIGLGCDGLYGVQQLADADAKLVGERSDDWSGRGVSQAGDVDLDGYDDILVAAWGEDSGGREAGAAYLLRGPITGTMSLASADAKLIGESAGDYAGKPAAGAGDVNGDGLPDIIVGAYCEGSGGYQAGAAYLVLGPVSGNIDLSTADAKFLGIAAGDETGKHLAGNFDADGDGLTDLIIGAAQQDMGGSSAGAAYLIYGPVTGTVDLATADALLVGEDAGDEAGKSVSASDLDGDGVADLLVGASGDDDGGTDGGAAYVIMGPVTGMLDLSAADAKLVAESADDYAGKFICGVGDTNADGLEDFMVGASRHDITGSNDGAAYLVLGPVTASGSLSTAQAKLTGEADGDYAGVAVSEAGDVDGDGFDDIMVGAGSHDTNGAESGAAYLLFGPVSGTVSLSDSDARLYGEAADDRAGHDVSAAGDVDGDGFGDILVGAYQHDATGSEAGATYLFLAR